MATNISCFVIYINWNWIWIWNHIWTGKTTSPRATSKVPSKRKKRYKDDKQTTRSCMHETQNNQLYIVNMKRITKEWKNVCAEIKKACMDLSCLVSGGRSSVVFAPLKLKTFLPQLVDTCGRWRMALALALVCRLWMLEDGVSKEQSSPHPCYSGFWTLDPWLHAAVVGLGGVPSQAFLQRGGWGDPGLLQNYPPRIAINPLNLVLAPCEQVCQ